MQQWVVAPVPEVAPPAAKTRSMLVFAVPAALLVVAGALVAVFATPSPMAPAPAVITAPVVTPPPVPKEPEPEPVVVTPPPKPATKPPSSVRPAADACNPPFTIGANGVKQFKVECLK